jgi:hypothetical protein
MKTRLLIILYCLPLLAACDEELSCSSDSAKDGAIQLLMSAMSATHDANFNPKDVEFRIDNPMPMGKPNATTLICRATLVTIAKLNGMELPNPYFAYQVEKTEDGHLRVSEFKPQ